MTRGYPRSSFLMATKLLQLRWPPCVEKGKVQLSHFDHFLHWLDKNLGELFQEALRKVKKERL